MFSVGVDSNPSQCPAESYFPRDLGESFIDSYFRIIHPQVPVLVYLDVVKSWDDLWNPPWERRDTKGDEILFMVLAIGARVCSFEGKQNTRSSEGWAQHFVDKAKRLNDAFEDISMSSTHFMLLKVRFFSFPCHPCCPSFPRDTLLTGVGSGDIRLPGHEAQ